MRAFPRFREHALCTTGVSMGRISRCQLMFVGLALAVMVGVFLRLVWVADMEYKYDEAWTFERTQEAGLTEISPWLGMSSSVGVKNPGMSVWVFVILGKIFAVQDPTGLARAVQVMNSATVLLLIAFAFSVMNQEEREPWLWGAVLGSVNPLAVLFHRKIWPQSILPIFMLAMLVGWWHRQRRWGAFSWGLVGALLGQIHMPGFFFAAGFALWTMLFDRRRVSWLSWVTGSCVGAIPLVPWLPHLFRTFGESRKRAQWSHVLNGEFWTTWVTEPFGLGLKYSLGPSFKQFRAFPLFDGVPTHLVGLLHVLIILLMIVILLRAGYQFWLDRRQWRDGWFRMESHTALAVNAALFGYGILLTALGFPFYRHYLVVTFPLMFVWVARLTLFTSSSRQTAMQLGRALLLTLCILEGLLSANFLYYIHVNQGAIHGDYGLAYGAQYCPEKSTSPENADSVLRMVRSYACFWTRGRLAVEYLTPPERHPPIVKDNALPRSLP